MTSKYADERLALLYPRVDELERAIDVAGAFLERAGDDPELAKIYCKLALTTLRTGIVQTFRSALLCSDDTTDEQLDHWLSVMAQEAAEEARPT